MKQGTYTSITTSAFYVGAMVGAGEVWRFTTLWVVYPVQLLIAHVFVEPVIAQWDMTRKNTAGYF